MDPHQLNEKTVARQKSITVTYTPRPATSCVGGPLQLNVHMHYQGANPDSNSLVWNGILYSA